MARDIKVNYSKVKSSRLLVTSLVGTGMIAVGKAVCDKVTQAVRESGGEGVIASKLYLSQEKKMMDTLGEGLTYLMNHIDQAAKEIQEVDHQYAGQHIE